MKISLAQINPTVGDIGNNTNKILKIINKSSSDLIVFPELSITGYSPGDLILKQSFVNKNIDALKKITSVSQKPSIVGFIGKDKLNKTYNSAAFIKNKKIANIHSKICLPTYSLFDEKRWFSKGEEPTILNFKNKKIGLNICEDIWSSEVPLKQKRSGADFIINISASPFSTSKIEQIERTLIQRNIETNIPILYCNQVGAQDGIVYYGHSMFVQDGKTQQTAKDFEEDLLTIQL
tara:strand:- start:19093 stop:19797 length:705 start_codon:yes stop_codon:yes gene_type:complete